MQKHSKLTGPVIDHSSSRDFDSYFRNVPVCVKELFAGGVSGVLAKTAVAPLERIKILQQARTDGFYSIGVRQCAKKIVKYEGIRGLYKGNTTNIIRIIPLSGIHYMIYEHYRSLILQNFPSLGTGPIVALLAGSASRATAFSLTYPLDVAHTKLAYQVVDRNQFFVNGIKCIHSRPAYDGLKDVFRKVYREGGVLPFYRGLGPTVVGILPYTGLKFFVYESLKREVPQEDRNSISIGLACGAVAGLFGQSFTYPLDVVRKQMQIDYVQQGESRYRNTIHGISSIIRTQGWRQLYAGFSINYLKAVPSVAIGFSTYDVMKTWLHISTE